MILNNCHQKVAKSSIILVLTLGALPVFGQLKPNDCMYKKNTICQKLVKLNPKLDHKQAYKYSNYFHKMAKKYNLDPNLLISIAFQESSFKADAIRKIKGLVFDEKGESFKEVKIGADFCMMQIHASNIKKLEAKKTERKLASSS